MKKFFGKQVIERPRSGSSSASRKARSFGRIVNTEDGPEYFGETKLPMSMNGRAHGWDSKNFTDVLGPLKGYLRSACGRQWDDVYSEISQILGNAGYALGHILTEHLDVATHTWRGVSGKVWDDTSGTQDVSKSYRTSFYVEPETGILREAVKGESYKTEARRLRRAGYVRSEATDWRWVKPSTFQLEENTQLKKIDKIWYYIEYSEREVQNFVRVSRATGLPVFRIDKVLDIRWKQQLNKKELRRYGLRNGD